jgi:hypothetical protein
LTPLSDGSILAAGGIPKGSYTGGSEVFRFLPATNTWVPMTPLLNQWWNNYKAVLVSGTRILFVGYGGSLQYGNTPELYSPFSGASGAAALTTPVNASLGFNAAPFGNGNVLLTGGSFSCVNNSGPCGTVSVDTATVFDSATETWTSVGPMTDKRAYHTATLLQNGQVLVAGGQSFYNGAFFINYSGLNSAELFGTPNATGTINVTTNRSATFTITGPATYNGRDFLLLRLQTRRWELIKFTMETCHNTSRRLIKLDF